MSNHLQKEKLQKCIEELHSSDMEMIEKAILDLKECGDSSVIQVLSEIYSKCNTKIKHQIIEFIADIKDSKIVKTLMDTIINCEDEETKAALLSTIWGSKNDFSSYLDVFVEIAIKGSLAEAIECYSIIDNIEEVDEAVDLLEAKMLLKENLKDIAKNEQRLMLLSEIMLKIESLDK